MSNVVNAYADLIVCPACGESVSMLEEATLGNSTVGCSAGKSRYPSKVGSPFRWAGSGRAGRSQRSR